MDSINLKDLNEKYIAVAENTSTAPDDEKIVFTLYTENWNDFDNDHYILSIKKNDAYSFAKAETLEEINKIAQESAGNKQVFFSKDEYGEIQGDVYGKVVR